MKGKSRDRHVAEKLASPVVMGASVALNFAKLKFDGAERVSLAAAVEVLEEKVKTIQGGDLKEAEATLVTQAITLDAIFTELARRAAANLSANLDATERLLRLAFKAQGQSRATLETLAAIKNPPVIFARQANIANGAQQVNYHAVLAPRAHAEDSEVGRSRLLEISTNGERLDAGAASTTGRSDSSLAALAAIYRAEN